MGAFTGQGLQEQKNNSAKKNKKTFPYWDCSG